MFHHQKPAVNDPIKQPTNTVDNMKPKGEAKPIHKSNIDFTVKRNSGSNNKKIFGGNIQNLINKILLPKNPNGEIKKFYQIPAIKALKQPIRNDNIVIQGRCINNQKFANAFLQQQRESHKCIPLTK